MRCHVCGFTVDNVGKCGCGQGRASSCTVGADVLLVAVKDIFRDAPGSAIRGVGRFKAGTPLYGHRACIYPRLWAVTDRNSSWPWCVGVPDEFVAEEKPNAPRQPEPAAGDRLDADVGQGVNQ